MRGRDPGGEGGLVPDPAGVGPADQQLGDDRRDAGLGEESGASPAAQLPVPSSAAAQPGA